MLAACRATVRNDLSRLSIVSRELERVYGYGEVSQTAAQAIEAAREETSTTLGTSMWRRSSSRNTLTIEQAASAFCAAVVRQHRAAEPVRPSDGSAE